MPILVVIGRLGDFVNEREGVGAGLRKKGVNRLKRRCILQGLAPLDLRHQKVRGHARIRLGVERHAGSFAEPAGAAHGI